MAVNYRAQFGRVGPLFGLLSLLGAATCSVAAQPQAKPETPVIIDQSKTPVVNPDYIPAEALLRHTNPQRLPLRSSSAMVFDARDNTPLLVRNAAQKRPIASLTKLMTAMVVLDAGLALDEPIEIRPEDKDRIRYSASHLKEGTIISRGDALLLALAASENRAAWALARTFPGGKAKFVANMNEKARSLGMNNSRFADSAGLLNENESTAADLVKMVAAATDYYTIKEFTTTYKDTVVNLANSREIQFVNTNRLVANSNWDINVSKTGYTVDAGNCLVMEVDINDRPVIVVLLNSWGKMSKFGDANRIRNWLLTTETKARKNSKAPDSTPPRR